MTLKKETPKVRICAYPADWLTRDGFDNNSEIIWSTGQTTQPGDIQVFAVSSTLGDVSELEHDRRRDAVHSIWEAVTAPKDEYWEEAWPVQAKFKLLVKLQNSVPKSDLLQAGLLKRQWPRHWNGKIFRSKAETEKLGEVLAKKNPKQRRAIFNALNL